MTLSLGTLFNKIPQKDRAYFMRQLAIMVSSGVPISNALGLASQQTSNDALRQSLRVITSDVANGHPFSTAAARYPNIFDQVSLSMLKTGEASGQMQVVLNEMANHTEKSMDFSSKVRGALLYPAFVLIVMVIVSIVMTTVIIPRLTSVFTETNLQLPWTTQLLIGLSNLLIKYWYILLGLTIAAIFGARSYFSTPGGRETLYSLQMRIPVIKRLILNSYLTRFTSVLSMLIKSGVPFTDALRIVSESMPSQIWRTALQTVREEVERGIPLSAALSRHKMIPGTLVQMIAVGEQTGKLDTVLDNMANSYENETNAAVKGITSLVEPVVLMVVALGVAFVVIAVIVPIFGLAQQF